MSLLHHYKRPCQLIFVPMINLWLRLLLNADLHLHVNLFIQPLLNQHLSLSIFRFKFHFFNDSMISKGQSLFNMLNKFLIMSLRSQMTHLIPLKLLCWYWFWSRCNLQLAKTRSGWLSKILLFSLNHRDLFHSVVIRGLILHLRWLNRLSLTLLIRQN